MGKEFEWRGLPPIDEIREPRGMRGQQAEARARLMPAVRWLNDRMKLARTNVRFDRALRAIKDLQAVHTPGMDLSHAFATVACLAVSRKGEVKDSWESLWALGTGKTWKALTAFPERVRRMAKEVGQLNVSHFFAPAVFANARTVQAQISRKHFNQLPGIMRVYAVALEAHIARVPHLTVRSFPRYPRGRLHAALILSGWVKIATGKWCDRLVAELLNAAAIALGEHREFDALTITQARSRFKKKT